MKKQILCLLFVVTILFAGCSAKTSGPIEYTRDLYSAADTSDWAYEEYAAAPSAGAVGNAMEAKSIPALEPATVERMIVRNAELAISVFDPADAVRQVNEIAAAMGGYVVSSTSGQRTTSYSSGENLLYGEASIRVPANRLGEALAAIETLTTDPEKYVRSKNISGKDITSDYVDSQSRMTSLETTRDKLYEIMEKAETVEETLDVYMEISNIESEIEVLKGQLVYMEQSAALSSIYVSIQQIPPERVVEIRGWDPKAIVNGAIQDLIDASQKLLEQLIYFVISVLPILLVIGLPLFFIIRAIVRAIVRSDQAAKKTRSEENSEVSDLGKTE